MSRLRSFYSAQQYFESYPPADEAERSHVEEIFDRHPWLSWHPHFSICAHDPVLTDLVIDLTYCLMFEVTWTQRRSRWHALLTMDKILHSEDPYLSHLNSSHTRSDLSEEQLVSLDFPLSEMFGDEERLTMELAKAVLHGEVSDELFAQVHDRYGDKETVECAVALGLWAFFNYVEAALGVDPRTRLHTRALWNTGWVYDSLDFGEELVDRATRAVLDDKRPVEEVAAELGVPPDALRAWLSRAADRS